MVNGNTGTLTMRLVRSKLRKRDECRSASPTNAASAATAAVAGSTSAAEDHHENEDDRPPTVTFSNTETSSNCSPAIKDHQHVTFVRTSGVSAQQQTVGHGDGTAIAEWTFPPKAPVPHIYHINPVANDKNSFKGFRKQFSGRFKRLVARKPEPAPVIPPELKPQLKTIYVY